ncbi:MAG: GAF domain-containing protein [Alphaproteobacteria bacterium]|nr:MAG: GAF domain-containing protein [Alphaproteobacteria bacterium]
MHDAVPDQHEHRIGSGPADETKAAASPILDVADAAVALEAGKVGVWSWDIQSNRVKWSGNMEEIHGMPAGSFDGTLLAFQRDIHPEDQPEIMSAVQESVRTGKPYHAHYRLAPQGDKEERWVEAMASVIHENGVAVRMLGTCRDVTDRQRLLRELRMRAKQQEAVARLGERALTDSDLQKLFDEIAATVAEILDVEFVKILELVPGDAELLLRAGVGWREGLVGTAHESTGRHSQAGYALASGAPVIVTDLKSETRFEGPALLRDHGVNCGVSVPIAGRDGRAYGVLGAHTARRRRFNEQDVSFIVTTATVIAGAIQRRQADQRHELMIRELRHRSGNLFAQLLALFSQTARNSRSVAELTSKYEARVLALANAHRLITEAGWQSTSLLDLLRVLLAPYIDRVTFTGPEVFLEPDPSFALSSAVHELATNASKYGSLSNDAGRLELAWTVNRTDQGLRLDLDWKERGGPVPKRPRRVGFGSRLIGMVIERQLGGEMQRTFGPQGMEARLVVPLSHERWPEPARPAGEKSDAERIEGSPAP